MKYIKPVLAFLFVLPITSPIKSQTVPVPIEFSGEIRARGEADGRDFNNDSAVNAYTLLRTRFGARMKPLDDVDVYIQMQDSRVFGGGPSDQSAPNIDVHQAYFEVRNLWQLPILLKVGRQELSYGRQRLIGSNDFDNVGNTFDAIKIILGKRRNLSLFGATIKESSTPGDIIGRESADFKLWGLYYEHRKRNWCPVDLYAFWESNALNIGAGKELNRITLGTKYDFRLNEQFDVKGESAYQAGRRQGQTVKAFLLSNSLGYTIRGYGSPQLRIGLDYLSGMAEGDREFRAFDTLFAANHKFYGFMDYFLNIPASTNYRGLQDLSCKAKIPFSARIRLDTHIHNFRATAGQYPNLGNELDLILSYLYNSAASFQFGVTFLAPQAGMQNLFGDDEVGFWSYMTFLVKF